MTCCMLLQAEQRAAVHLLTRILNSVNTAAAAAALQRMTAWLHQHQAQDTRSGVSSLYPDQQWHQAQPAQHCRWWRGGGADTAQSRGTRGLAHTSTHVAPYTRVLTHEASQPHSWIQVLGRNLVNTSCARGLDCDTPPYKSAPLTCAASAVPCPRHVSQDDPAGAAPPLLPATLPRPGHTPA